eukprot:8776035-Pyramimonas_sp.AAC.1
MRGAPMSHAGPFYVVCPPVPTPVSTTSLATSASSGKLIFLCVFYIVEWYIRYGPTRTRILRERSEGEWNRPLVKWLLEGLADSSSGVRESWGRVEPCYHSPVVTRSC